MRITAREFFVIVLFWTSLAAISSLNRLLDPRGFGFRFSPAAPVAMTFIETAIWAALTPLIFWLASRYSFDRTNWMTRLPLLIGCGVVISIGVYTLLLYARAEVFETVRVPPRAAAGMFTPFREIGRFRFLNQLLLYFAILAAGFAREFFLQGQLREREAVQLEAQLAAARLDALRMQINPHFLFNTLNAVSALVERDPAGVRRMIARLSELLRHTIDTDRAGEVPLRAELAFLRRYVEIMEIRFQGKLHVSIDVPDDALDALVPDLILQPLVENAFEHGATRVAGLAEVTIAARREGGRLILSVRDNGPGADVDRVSGVGLANTRARLAHGYGDAARLSLSTMPGGGALAEIAMPLRHA